MTDLALEVQPIPKQTWQNVLQWQTKDHDAHFAKLVSGWVQFEHTC